MNIDKMTAAQRRAVDSDAKEILCVAGPGSGKTTVLAARINRICDQGAPPQAMCAITYTNAAARNLDARIGAEADLGYSGTLHGFAMRMLKRHGEQWGYGERTAIIDEDASRELLEGHAKSIGCKTPIDKLMKLKALGRPKGPNFTADALVVLAYQDELCQNGLLDFDLILTEFYRLLTVYEGMSGAIEQEFAYLFVDEVQDSALVDWKIFRHLPIANKFLVGDPDQAIFGFRGGMPALMRPYSVDPRVQTLYLEENFRCRNEICRAANNLIAGNFNRLEKATISAVGPGGRVTKFGETLNEGDEIAQVMGYLRLFEDKPEEIAIIARTNAIAAGFREAIKAAGIPVSEPPKPELPPDWALARAIIEMMAQPANDTLAYFYCIAKAKSRGASDKDARGAANEIRNNARKKGERINQGWAGAPPTLMEVPSALDRDHVSLESRMIVGEIIRDLPITSAAEAMLAVALEVAHLDRAPADPPSAGLTVTTIHAAKGLEWDFVFLVGFEDEVIPGASASADIEEERRLVFVALTRARKEVFISHAAARRATWGNKPVIPHTPSRFLKEISS